MTKEGAVLIMDLKCTSITGLQCGCQVYFNEDSESTSKANKDHSFIHLIPIIIRYYKFYQEVTNTYLKVSLKLPFNLFFLFSGWYYLSQLESSKIFKP